MDYSGIFAPKSFLMKTTSRIAILIGFVLIISSCVSRQKIAYFQGIEEYTSVPNMEPVTIKPNDMLSIIVSAANLESVVPFNLTAIARPISSANQIQRGAGVGGQTQEIPYMVDNEGKILFPVLGEIAVEGLSPKELRDELTHRLKEYVIDPVVNVRILNFTITVLGEVGQPGTYGVTGERVALPEALGLASDITIFGRRDNVLVIREVEGKKTYRFLNLLDADVLNSDFYYLQQHDVVYVEPNRAHRQSSIFNRNLSVYVSVASLLLTLYVIIKKP